MFEEDVVIDYPRGCIHIGKSKRQAIYWQTQRSAERNKLELPELSEEANPDLINLINEFQDLFETGLCQPTTRTVEHKILLSSDKVINRRCYQLNPHKKQILYKQVDEMLQKGVIEPTNSAYSSPPVIVERADKEPRFCVDFRELNKITLDESINLPRITDSLKDLSTANIFSVLDLKKGYWQIPMEINSKQYTAFSTPDGAAYHFNVMPFGLKLAPSTFQKLMATEVLVGYIQNFVIVYLDDIIIFSNSVEEHLNHLRLVFERLQQHNLKVSGKKCQLFKTELDYLGHRIVNNKVEPLEKHRIRIKNFKEPKTKKQVQSFLGLCNWLREYVPNMAHLTAPLTELLKKNHKFKWTELQQEAFENVQRAIENCNSLHRPDYTKPFILQTDASSIGMSSVLYQEDAGGNRNIISYASAKFSNTTRKYHINEQECLAVIWALKLFNGYLEGSKFTLRTDSKALTWLHKFKDTKAKLTRWSMLLQEYNFDIEHVSGKNNEFCDFLSRFPEENINYQDTPDDERLLPPTAPESRNEQTPPSRINLFQINHSTLVEKVIEEQRRCRYVKNILKHFEILHTDARLRAKQRKVVRFYNVQDGVLFKKSKHGDKLVVPRKISRKVIYTYHDEDDMGHPGVDETIKKISLNFFWIRMREDISHYIKNCIPCSLCKTQQKQDSAPMRARSPKHPFQMLSFDVLGPYNPPGKKTRAKFILVMEDVFSRWTEAKAFRRLRTEDFIDYLETEIIPRFGTPETIVTDNGGIFISNKINDLCTRYSIKQAYSSIYHQQANPVERKIQEFKKVMRTLIFKKPTNHWEVVIPKVLQILRSRVCRATGVTPASIVLGYELPGAGDWQISFANKRKNYSKDLRKNKNKEIFHKIKKYQLKEYHDESEPRVEFRPGQFVHSRARAREKLPFSNPWTGPWEIVSQNSPTTYEVLINGKQVNVHLDDLRPAPTGNQVNFEEEDELTSESDSDASVEFGVEEDRDFSSDDEEENLPTDPQTNGEPLEPNNEQITEPVIPVGDLGDTDPTENTVRLGDDSVIHPEHQELLKQLEDSSPTVEVIDIDEDGRETRLYFPRASTSHED